MADPENPQDVAPGMEATNVASGENGTAFAASHEAEMRSLSQQMREMQESQQVQWRQMQDMQETQGRHIQQMMTMFSQQLAPRNAPNSGAIDEEEEEEEEDREEGEEGEEEEEGEEDGHEKLKKQSGLSKIGAALGKVTQDMRKRFKFITEADDIKLDNDGREDRVDKEGTIVSWDTTEIITEDSVEYREISLLGSSSHLCSCSCAKRCNSCVCSCSCGKSCSSCVASRKTENFAFRIDKKVLEHGGPLAGGGDSFPLRQRESPHEHETNFQFKVKFCGERDAKRDTKGILVWIAFNCDEHGDCRALKVEEGVLKCGVNETEVRASNKDDHPEHFFWAHARATDNRKLSYYFESVKMENHYLGLLLGLESRPMVVGLVRHSTIDAATNDKKKLRFSVFN